MIGNIKTLFPTIALTGLIVLLGVVCWQQVQISQLYSKNNSQNSIAILGQDLDYGFKIVTSESCKDVFVLEEAPGLRRPQSDYSTIKEYTVYAKNDPDKVRYVGYSVMDPKEVKRIEDDGNIFWPGIVDFYTKKNALLVKIPWVGEPPANQYLRNVDGMTCPAPTAIQIP